MSRLTACALSIAAVLLSACGSPVPPQPSGATPSLAPDQTPPPAESAGPLVSPAAIFAPASLPPAVIPGLPPGPEVQWLGNEYLAAAYSALDCNALAGWLQASDWLIDGRLGITEASPAPSPAGSSDPDIIPTSALAISRPGDAAMVRLGPAPNGGCNGTITRGSRQEVVATGDVTVTTGALAYPLGCTPAGAGTVTWMGAFFGDDGTVALARGVLPLVLGEQEMSEASLRIGRSERRLSNSLQAFVFSTDDALEEFATGLGSYAVDPGSTARMTITSIDPLIGTLSFADFKSSAGGTQSMTVGIRCDAPNNTLTDTANTVSATPTLPPTQAPGGHLAIQIGSGGNALDEQVDGPGVMCSLFDYGGGNTTWQLTYTADSPDGLVVSLSVPSSGEPFMTARLGGSSYAADGTGGSGLEATVDDRGTEVDFTADGQVFGGDPVHIDANCRNVRRV